MNAKELRLPNVESDQQFAWVLFSSLGEELSFNELSLGNDYIPFWLGDGYSVDWFNRFVWDHLTNDLILNLFKTCEYRDLGNAWQDQQPIFGGYASLCDRFHAERIAIMAKHLKEGGSIKPTELEFDEGESEFSIRDGNHRIRALQFLKFDAFPIIIDVENYKHPFKAMSASDCIEERRLEKRLSAFLDLAEHKGFIIKA